ncbi:MAG: 4-hydroxy-3-methylbut-2-enyl diphosphate reductase [Bacteroidales bacterium]|nr:4-hydroxy-3-methylbut-2-enyl diphosphate reductase [Bacteroidales bacterium]
MEIVIDEKSGFCFGVKRAIDMAEKEIQDGNTLYCLGEIVHNKEEVTRLERKGIKFIDRETFFKLQNCKVLIRAHGEPPFTYQHALKNKIELIDATCPVVIKLQEKVKNVEAMNPDGQIVIYGRKEHPEVIGLAGQVKKAIVIESEDDLELIDFHKKIFLFAQTTKDKNKYILIKNTIAQKLHDKGIDENNLIPVDSICGQVANRAPWLEKFSREVDALIFVGGVTSSNSKMLFEICKKNNPKSYFVTKSDDLDNIDLTGAKSVGISGATSTPSWLINEIADKIEIKSKQ